MKSLLLLLLIPFSLNAGTGIFNKNKNLNFSYTYNCSSAIFSSSIQDENLTFTWLITDLENNKTDTAIGETVIYTPLSPGFYNVYLKSTDAGGNNNYYSEVLYLKVPDKPVARIESVYDLCQHVKSHFYLTFTTDTFKYKSYYLDFGDGNFSINENHHIYRESGFHKVTLIYSNGFCSDTTVTEIYIYDFLDERCSLYYYPKVFVPQTFTPNSDGRNDIFKYHISNFFDWEITIWCRWKGIVFTSNFENRDKYWDGTYKGEKLPEGVYAYRIRGYGLDNKEYVYTGTVTIIR